jgi:5-methylcytosine-specific restriction endonuclease McrA/predicted kinase
MPARALRPCKHPGCGRLSTDGACSLHAAQIKRERSNWSQKPPTERGYGSTWVKIRKLAMLRDGAICKVCLAEGRVTQATEIDHIIPKSQGGTDEEDNLQAICKRCHAHKTALESAIADHRVSYYPDWIPEPRIPVTIVCGPPGSGKTTYVRQNAGKKDLVIDVDEIAAEITGKPIYHATDDELSQAIRARNKLLASCAESNLYQHCWLIITGKFEHRRQWWREKLKGNLVVLNTPKRICMDRVKKDQRRPPESIKRAVEAILAWE